MTSELELRRITRAVRGRALQKYADDDELYRVALWVLREVEVVGKTALVPPERGTPVLKMTDEASVDWFPFE